MIKTVLFDLDGTLLQFKQDDFVNEYLRLLGKTFAKLGLDPALAVKALWAGTKAMVMNDGGALNRERFWETFSGLLNISGEKLKETEAACDAFYSNEFDGVKSVLNYAGETVNEAVKIPKRIIGGLKEHGFDVILATNPLFPTCAVETRLAWAGLKTSDFLHVTDYGNSAFCKPNTYYYTEIFKKTGKNPKECLMVGNNAREDLCVRGLGAKTILVTDYLETDGSKYETDAECNFSELEKCLEDMLTLRV